MRRGGREIKGEGRRSGHAERSKIGSRAGERGGGGGGEEEES